MAKVSKEKKEIKNAIRVLQIGMHDKIGGVETFLMNYYRNIDRKKIQFDFISTYEKLCFEDEIKSMGGKVYNVISEKKNPFRYYKELKKIIVDGNYKIVHINMLSAANILSIIASKKASVKNIIIHSHNTNTPIGMLRKVLDKFNRRYLKIANHYWACSKKAGMWLFGEKKINNIEVINNAIDYDKFYYNEEIRNRVRKKLKVSKKFVIGNVARFSYQKNQSFLIDVFNELQKINDNFILLLVGEGELEKELKSKIEYLNLSNKVIFTGVTNNVEEYLNCIDLFVLPSRFEGLPVTGIEAQVSGNYCMFSENITEETKICDNCEFIELDIELWVNAIIKFYNSNYEKNTSSLDNSYNIKYATKKIEDFYKKMNGN